MSESNYRDLNVWKKARQLTRDIYRVTRAFPKTEMFCLTQQMRKAAISIISNIAEAHGRRTNGERANLLGVARGSTFELESQLIVAHDLEYTVADQASEIGLVIRDVIRMLNGLIRHYETP